MPVFIDEGGLKKLFPEIEEISDSKLKQGIIDIWLDIAAETAWSRFEDIPKNLKSEKYRSLMTHIRSVTRMALSIAEIAKETQGTPCDRDMLIAACLLHDVSKIVESEPDPKGEPTGGSVLPGRTSGLGSNLPHAAYATHKILEKGLPVELAHLVITHTHSSNVRGKGWESAALFYADFADTDAGIIPTGDEIYSRRWKLH